jgi:ribonuclease HII
VYRIGVDENGLGSRLGPLIVTAVLARASDAGEVTLRRKLPKSMRASLDDSKKLVSHRDVSLGEAWARVLVGAGPSNPGELFARLSLEGVSELQRPCPDHASAQCWRVEGEDFQAPAALLKRVERHRALLQRRGVEILAVQSSVICTERLNHARRKGKNRFVSDLHAMEALVIAQRKLAGENVRAVCGKVGGMGEYSKFFGPLGGWLHAVIEEGQARSSYRFPTIGDVSFVRDADQSDALVMLASLVGKYVRELFMGRIARYYGADDEETRPSGYHDPVTAGFVERSALLRRRRKIPERCFERDREPIAP